MLPAAPREKQDWGWRPHKEGPGKVGPLGTEAADSSSNSANQSRILDRGLGTQFG